MVFMISFINRYFLLQQKVYPNFTSNNFNGKVPKIVFLKQFFFLSVNLSDVKVSHIFMSYWFQILFLFIKYINK